MEQEQRAELRRLQRIIDNVQQLSPHGKDWLKARLLAVELRRS